MPDLRLLSFSTTFTTDLKLWGKIYSQVCPCLIFLFLMLLRSGSFPSVTDTLRRSDSTGTGHQCKDFTHLINEHHIFYRLFFVTVFRVNLGLHFMVSFESRSFLQFSISLGWVGATIAEGQSHPRSIWQRKNCQKRQLVTFRKSLREKKTFLISCGFLIEFLCAGQIHPD